MSGAASLPVQTVGLVGRRSQAVLEHDGHQLVDAPGRLLLAKVEGLVAPERLAKDEHGVRVGRLHSLAKHKQNNKVVQNN